MQQIWAVEWTEFERGWGQRPDGWSLHSSKDDAESFIKDYNDTNNTDNNPPGIYSQLYLAKEPSFVDEKFYKFIKEEKYYYSLKNSLSGCIMEAEEIMKSKEVKKENINIEEVVKYKTPDGLEFSTKELAEKHIINISHAFELKKERFLKSDKGKILLENHDYDTYGVWQITDYDDEYFGPLYEGTLEQVINKVIHIPNFLFDENGRTYWGFIELTHVQKLT